MVRCALAQAVVWISFILDEFFAVKKIKGTMGYFSTACIIKIIKSRSNLLSQFIIMKIEVFTAAIFVS